MILKPSIFDTGKLLIVNANKPNKGEYSRLMSIIEDEENDFLYNCLGGLATEYIEGINQTTPDQKWLDLRDGAEYTKNDVTLKFKGLNQILAHYIWVKYQEKVSESSINGEVQIVSEQVSNNRLLVNVWNDMIDLIGGNACISEYKPNLRDFLDDGDYEDYNVFYYEYINQLL